MARRRLAALPGRTALGQRISALSGDSVATSGLTPLADGSMIYEQRAAGSQFYALYRRDASGAVTTLIDPATMRDGDSHISIDWWDVSPDERYLVYGLSAAGSEASILHIMELSSRRVLPERIPNTDFGSLSWLPDNSGFFYLAMTGERGTPELYLNSEQRLHRLGSDAASDSTVVRRGLYADVPMTEGQFAFLSVIRGTPYTLMGVADQNPEQMLYLTRTEDLAAGRPSWTVVATVEDKIFDHAAGTDTLWFVSEKDASRRKLLAAPLSTPAVASAREVVPASEAVLESVYAIKGGAIITLLDGGNHRLSRIDASGVHPITLPFAGSADILHAVRDEEPVFVNLSGWLNPTTLLRIAPDGSVTDTGITPRPPIDVTGYVAEQRFATARDGTRIPYVLMARRGWTTNRANPTMVSAYGAYGMSATPGFMARVIAFLDAGGVYVDAGVRGGGEYGREWHEAGKKATKPNTWRDMIDVCEALIAEGVTAKTHLVGHGVSAGGITIGRAVTERPDLFAGAIAEVGFMNPIRYVAEQNVADIEEWGPIEDAESFRIMYEMDAYRAVLDRPAPSRWPKMLVTTGINDPRAATFHSAKFAAALEAKGADVMLRVDFDAGHGIGSTRDQTDALRADEYAFTLAVAGNAR